MGGLRRIQASPKYTAGAAEVPAAGLDDPHVNRRVLAVLLYLDGAGE
jgi:hypothetical protein